jgi:hypothetical protein
VSSVETGSPDCGGGACLVDHLPGDPRPGCDPSRTVCPSAEEVERKVHCTCRCDRPADGTGPTCHCPDGFLCAPLLRIADPALRGSYCCNAEDPSCVERFCADRPDHRACR